MHATTRPLPRRAAARLPVLVAVALGAMATGCADGDEASTTSATAPTTSATASTASGTATGGVDTTGGATTAGGTPLPTDDAAAVRDELLELAAEADFGGELSPGTAIVERWLEAYPGLQLSLFDDQPATAEVLSSSTAFLIAGTDSTIPEVAGEQHFAFAVLDTAGTCAGGIAVIPGDADGAVSDARTPAEFAPVATPPEDCSAEATSDRYGER